jgi:N6-L-threonylcarbamoyladenine synthase
MRILSIETSCDETAVALLQISGPLEKPEIKTLGNTLLSQAHLHEEFGGVYPNLAKREHQKNLPPLLAQTLKEAGENDTHPNIDFIAVTTGPGLEPALWTGITFAEDLAKKWQKPIIAVNHMEGHIWSTLYNLDKPLELPALALLVSGGHTELVHVKGFGEYEIIGRTKDDAVGEAYDKVARMLGLTYPGGPKISALADKARSKNLPQNIAFPRPMINSGDLNFSYSGLKTAVLYKLKAENRTDEIFKEEVARAFEDAAIEVLITKTRTALHSYSDLKTLIVAGGVSGNSYLQLNLKKLSAEQHGLDLHIPEKSLSTDNAVMIGIAGFIKASLQPDLLTASRENLEAQGNLTL